MLLVHGRYLQEIFLGDSETLATGCMRKRWNRMVGDINILVPRSIVVLLLLQLVCIYHQNQSKQQDRNVKDISRALRASPETAETFAAQNIIASLLMSCKLFKRETIIFSRSGLK